MSGRVVDLVSWCLLIGIQLEICSSQFMIAFVLRSCDLWARLLVCLCMTQAHVVESCRV